MWRLRSAAAALALGWSLVAALPSAEDAPPESLVAQYRALGLQPGAAPLDVQLAHTRLTSQYKPGTKFGSDARRQFVEAQQAFQALSDEGARQDALASVPYFDHVRRLNDDSELQHFTEFRPGGSAHLRIIFFLDSGSERQWSVWAAATQLNGSALVAQLGHRDARTAGGEAGAFMASFRLLHFPSAVIYDPISRAVKVSHGLDGVGEMAQRFLSGELSVSDKLARVQELDEESFRWRCGGGVDDSAAKCDHAFVLATTKSQEDKLDELMATLRAFVDASRMLHNVRDDTGKNIACFWLRLERGSSWDPLLRKHGMAALDSYAHVAVAWQPSPSVIVAPAHLAHGSTIALQGWFRQVVAGTHQPTKPVTGRLPALPPPVSPTDEPPEGFVERTTRQVKKQLAGVAPELERLVAWAQGEIKKMDTEEKVMVVGAALCAIWLLIFLMRRCCCCCCGRRSGTMSEDELLASLAAVVDVSLQRQPGEKLGMGIGGAPGDAFSITQVASGELVDRWNAAQPEAHRRVRDGDRVVGVTSASGQRAVGCGAMGEAMRGGGDLTLHVAMLRKQGEPQVRVKTASYVLLKDVTSLKSAAQFRSPQLSWAGEATASCLEIAAIGPELAEWNAKCAGCSMQRLEVGDLVVAVNGSMNVASQLEAASPLLLVARWRDPGAMRADRFEVSVQRSGQEDKLGLHIRQVPGTQHIETVEVFAEGAVARAGQGGRSALAGDRMVAVNGVTAVDGMKQEMAKLSSTFTIERWVDDSAGVQRPPPQAPAPRAPAPQAPPAASKPAPQAAAPRSVGGAGAGPSVADGLLSLLFVLALAGLLIGVGSGALPRAAPSRYVLGAAPSKDAYATAGLAAGGVGVLLALWFVWYELSMLWRPAERRTFRQLVVAASSSTCLGYGAFFLLTWAGVYA